jgi:putative CocE/NonD family hydrolase
VSPDWPDGAEQALYLAPDFGLSLAKPGQAGTDDYVSDPAKPVPIRPRPVHLDGDDWKTWLVQDQRFADDRPDVLSYRTPVLDKPVHIKGAPRVELHAATSGRDADWVVKLIDVYPREDVHHPEMSGYQLPLGIEIFRGRFVGGFSSPAPLDPGKPFTFRWSLPNVDHVFLPGHRIMVQVQSSLFPLYERNPQTWVPVVFDAKPGDYAKATQTIYRGGDAASVIWLPLAKD